MQRQFRGRLRLLDALRAIGYRRKAMRREGDEAKGEENEQTKEKDWRAI